MSEIVQLEIPHDGVPPKKGRGRPRKQPPKVEIPENGVFVTLDFGNYSTKLAYVDDEGHIRPIPDPDGLFCTPSYIAYEDGDPAKILCGRSAKNYSRIHSEFTCCYAKRMRGQGPVPAFVDSAGNVALTSTLEPLLVKWRLSHAEQYLGRPIAGVLVTTPAHFDSEQRRSTCEIMIQAGYTVVGVLNEPTGAVLGFAKNRIGTFAVFDIGGGTFDMSILSSEEGNVMRVLATNGQESLAGKECTARLFELCLKRAAHAGCVIDPSVHTKEIACLLDEVEKAKIDLSTQERTTIVFSANGRLMDVEVSRAEFEALIPDLLESIETLTRNSLRDANLQPEDIDGIVLAGGTCRMPCIQRLAEAMFGSDKVCRNVDPDLAVVLGACEALGTKVHERVAKGDLALPGNVPGLALQGVIQLREVLGQALGVLALDMRRGCEIMAPILPQGRSLPANETHVFGLSNGDRHGTGTVVRVLQGNDFEHPAQNRVLAAFQMDHLPAGPVKDRISVTFDCDSDGLITVRAVDTFSGLEICGTADGRSAIDAMTSA